MRCRSLLCLFLLMAVSGCHNLVEPEIDVEDRTFVVLPLSDETREHFVSPTGIEVARSATNFLSARAEEMDYKVVPFKELEEAFDDRDPRKMTFAQIGEFVGADTVITGELSNFQTRGEGDVGFFQGRANVRMRVIDATDESGDALLEKDFEVKYPGGYFTTGEIAISEMTEQEVRRGLIRTTGMEIAKHFYDHEPDGSPREDAP